MRLALVVVLSVVACRKEPVAPVAVTTPPPPAVVEAPRPPANLGDLQRGEYVATISGCMVCHTPTKAGVPDRARLLAGGGFEQHMTDSSVWRAPNITPDRETGIGAWTDVQVITAIRTGVRPDGTRMLPVMPYPYHHRMTDADARAVVAYLRAQQPVSNRIPRSARPPMHPVALGEPATNVDPPDPTGHGEYLANLMHCGTCHTPETGPHAGVPFAGGRSFSLGHGRTAIARNLTSDRATGLGHWNTDQIVQAIRTMRRPRGMPIEGPMARYAEAWSKLTDSDAQALAVYIKSLPAVRHDVPDRHAAVTIAP